MNVTCEDRERILRDGSPEQWAALESHAATCAACAEELRAWNALSDAAAELRDYKEDPALWSRIETSLGEAGRQQSASRAFWVEWAFWRGNRLGWQVALSGACALVLALAGVYVFVHRPVGETQSGKLLKNSALVEVERTQRDYLKAIDKLAADAKPRLDSPESPLMASYREKLMVVDSAIDELREEASRNPSNAHLRYELLAMYQEKQQTLREVLETKR